MFSKGAALLAVVLVFSSGASAANFYAEFVETEISQGEGKLKLDQQTMRRSQYIQYEPESNEIKVNSDSAGRYKISVASSFDWINAQESEGLHRIQANLKIVKSSGAEEILILPTTIESNDPLGSVCGTALVDLNPQEKVTIRFTITITIGSIQVLTNGFLLMTKVE